MKKKLLLLTVASLSLILKPETYICSSVYCDEKGDESIFPNANSVLKSSSVAFQKIYWECATVMFATSMRLNPDATHILFTNKKKAPEPYKTVLKDLGVTLVQLPFAHKPPHGWHHKYKNSVYTLDIVQYLANKLSNDDITLVLDADVVWIKPAQKLLESVKQHGVLHYNLDYKPESMINGITLAQAQELYELLLGKTLESAPQHTGGELVAATGSMLKKISQEIEPAWKFMLKRFENNQTVFTTEEHFLSYIYHKLVLPEHANNFIRRIGTDKKVLRNVVGDEGRYTLWHLPAEKKRGFNTLFKLAQEKDSIFWTTPLGYDFASLCAHVCNVIP